MTDPKLERRMKLLEREIAVLRTKVDELSILSPWWERIAGTFHDDSIYRQAMKLGQEFRTGRKPDGARTRKR